MRCPRPGKETLREGVVALLLLSPVCLLYAAHYLAPLFAPGILPSGFIQLDQPFYPAAAREYLDALEPSLLYANPTDPDPHAPRIYFQLPLLLLSLLLKVFPGQPALALNTIGFVSAYACLWTGIRFWKVFTGEKRLISNPGIWLMHWGGGLFACSGLLYLLLRPRTFNGLFLLEPTQGWWFLNWGRNLVLPLEALYHLLFLLMILMLFQRKFVSAFLFSTLLIFSHPFTGLQAALVFLAFSSLERLAFKNKAVPVPLLLLATLALAWLLYYYLYFLPSFPSHQQVLDQWKLPWVLKPWQAAIAYGLTVGAGLISLFYTKGSYLKNDARTRLLLVWTMISILLVFHNLFMPAHQPLHFTRAYLWLPLFLLAYPSMKNAWSRFSIKNRIVGKILLIITLTLFFSDNALWFGLESIKQARGTNMHLSQEQQEVLTILQAETDRNSLVLSDDTRLSMHAILLSPARAWFSHWANTPGILDKIARYNNFRINGLFDKEWKGRRIYFIKDRQRSSSQSLSRVLNSDFEHLLQNRQFDLYRQKAVGGRPIH